MSRHLPPLNWVRAFEAAARHLSFTRAAEELNVTQAAISQHVKALEGHLGIALFRRVNNRLSLTYAGQAWLPKLSAGFDMIEGGIDDLRAYHGGGTLTVRLPSSFSIQWLTPRLERFHSHHPAIDIRLLALGREADSAGGEVDIEVRNGPGPWPDAESLLLMHEEVYPVCSPQLVDGRPGLGSPRDLVRFELLHVSGYREDWPMWLEAAGVGDLDMPHGLHFDQSVTAIQAAINGLGVALGRSPLVVGDLIQGRLVKPFDCCLASEDAYWIIYSKRRPRTPAAKAFCEWLLEEAAMHDPRPVA